MVRKLVTVVTLILLCAVVASWLRSQMAAESVTLNVAPHSQVIAKHAHGTFSIAWETIDLMVAMPHWLATAALAVWPLFHLRVRMGGPEVDAKKKK